MAEKKSAAKGSSNAKISRREEQPAPRGTQSAQQERQAPDRDAVARRAYERFVQRGGEHGRDLEDWVEAEKELGGH